MSLEEENTQLKQENKRLTQENEELKKRLAQLEPVETVETTPFQPVDKLTNEEIRRFGRQLIIPSFGIENQLKIRNKSFLIVGAGGLGSPCALYLGAGGVGRLGIVDHDTVDISNLHRQIIHTEAREGINKAVSAATAVKAIDSNVDVIPYTFTLDSTNALDLIKQYDIVIDATDNIATRYLLSDAAVLAGKPVVSGSALKVDGQLTIYNYKNGPCFRCLHPVPPPASSVSKCADAGVLGVVPGVIGTLEALQAIKVAIESPCLDEPSFLIFSALSNPMIRTMRLRNKKKDCIICGENPTMTGLIDYVEFCNEQANDAVVEEHILEPHQRIEVEGYNNVIKQNKQHLLIDVRPQVQFNICSLPNSVHIPIEEFSARLDDIKEMKSSQDISNDNVFVVCRLGNDSQLAVQMMDEQGIEGGRDIVGGLLNWSTRIDPSFPIY